MRELIVKSTEQTNIKFSSLQSTINEILTQNKELKHSIDFISKKYDEMKIKTDSLEKQRKEDRLYINQLESKVETLEQIILSSKLELKNIPIESTASKENLCEIVIKATNVLEVPLHQHEIKDIFRIKNKSGFGTITIPIFVSDHLSQRARRLNYLARTFAQEHGFRFCWTSNGRTYLRKNEGERHIRVDSESDLSTLKKEM
ncbi:hypothetical protein ACJJTC_005355 [Scirpophaga incertulas]